MEVDVTNTGEVEGQESVQFYVSQVSTPGLQRPVKELKGFGKVSLKPGETGTVGYKIDRYALGYFDTKVMSWVVDENAMFEVLAAASSQDVRGSTKFTAEGKLQWIK